MPLPRQAEVCNLQRFTAEVIVLYLLQQQNLKKKKVIYFYYKYCIIFQSHFFLGTVNTVVIAAGRKREKTHCVFFLSCVWSFIISSSLYHLYPNCRWDICAGSCKLFQKFTDTVQLSALYGCFSLCESDFEGPGPFPEIAQAGSQVPASSPDTLCPSKRRVLT